MPADSGKLSPRSSTTRCGSILRCCSPFVDSVRAGRATGDGGYHRRSRPVHPRPAWSANVDVQMLSTPPGQSSMSFCESRLTRGSCDALGCAGGVGLRHGVAGLPWARSPDPYAQTCGHCRAGHRGASSPGRQSAPRRAHGHSHARARNPAHLHPGYGLSPVSVSRSHRPASALALGCRRRAADWSLSHPPISIVK